MLFVVNAGHDRELDSGCVNYALGLRECDVAYDISEKIASRLNAYPNTSLLIQSDNLAGEDGYNYRYSVVNQCNVNEADYIVSIHLNAFNGEAHGSEILVYDEDSEMADMAAYVLDALVNTIGTTSRGIKERKDLAILRLTSAPTMLIEVGFLDNDEEAQLITENIQKIADAIADAILKYLES